jgi:hypothetical protein
MVWQSTRRTGHVCSSGLECRGLLPCTPHHMALPCPGSMYLHMPGQAVHAASWLARPEVYTAVLPTLQLALQGIAACSIASHALGCLTSGWATVWWVLRSYQLHAPYPGGTRVCTVCAGLTLCVRCMLHASHACSHVHARIAKARTRAVCTRSVL